MQYIGSNIRFIFTKIKELLNSHNTDNSAHSELFKSWKRLRNPNNADIADALAATYKNGIGDVLVEVKDDTTFALEDIKLFFRPAKFQSIFATDSRYEGIYITMDGTHGRYVAETFADSEIMMPEGPTTISTPSELVLYPAASDAVLYTAQTLTEEQKSRARTNIGAYTKPVGGIPKSDLADDVQTSLDKADTAISLGLTSATPGQIIKVKTVQDGKPTEWEAVDDRLPKVTSSDAGNVLGVEQIGEHEYGYALTHMPTLNDFIPLGITNASPGQFAKVSFVDDFGSPTAWEAADIYEKPTSGIPKSDLAEDVQTSLAKADTAISLGLTSATPGQIIKVKTVKDGKPTEWEAVDMDAGKLPKFTKLLTHTITEDELAASPIAFIWGTAQIPNLNDFNVFALTIVRPDGAKIEFNKWVKIKINSKILGNICGTNTAASPQYVITANRLFGFWISGNYYDPRNIGVPVLVPPQSSSTYQSDLPDSEPVTSIGFTSYAADYGLTAGIVVEIWGAK